MAVFEFVMVAVSIIIGLAIAEVLMGVLEILRAKAFSRTYWIHTAWVIQVFVLTVQNWASQWGLRTFDSWNYATLSMALAQRLGIWANGSFHCELGNSALWIETYASNAGLHAFMTRNLSVAHEAARCSAEGPAEGDWESF